MISRNWVITAAHCCDGKKTSQMTTNFGDWDRSTTSDGRNFFLRPDRFVIHPGWNRKTFENDVCLLHYRNIPFSDRVRPVCFPSPWEDDLQPGEVCYVAGWGIKLNDNGQKFIPKRPDEIAVMKIDNDVCNMGWGLNRRVKDESMMCAGHLKGGKDSCQGDSGGPLVCINRDNEPILRGVVSWGFGCARSGMPGVYAKSTAMSAWVHNTLKIKIPPKPVVNDKYTEVFQDGLPAGLECKNEKTKVGFQINYVIIT